LRENGQKNQAIAFFLHLRSLCVRSHVIMSNNSSLISKNFHLEKTENQSHNLCSTQTAHKDLLY